MPTVWAPCPGNKNAILLKAAGPQLIGFHDAPAHVVPALRAYHVRRDRRTTLRTIGQLFGFLGIVCPPGPGPGIALPAFWDSHRTCSESKVLGPACLKGPRRSGQRQTAHRKCPGKVCQPRRNGGHPGATVEFPIYGGHGARALPRSVPRPRLRSCGCFPVKSAAASGRERRRHRVLA
jgi:hypothetical protein